MYELSKFRYVYARKLRKAMETGNFRFVENKSYNNELGEPGIEHFWLYEGRRFNFSENQTEHPSGIQDLVRILKNESGIDHNKNFWKNRNGEWFLYLEIWYSKQGRQYWCKFHTPKKDAPEDEFGKLIADIESLQPKA